jgi:hypothetical protein
VNVAISSKVPRCIMSHILALLQQILITMIYC